MTFTTDEEKMRHDRSSTSILAPNERQTEHLKEATAANDHDESQPQNSCPRQHALSATGELHGWRLYTVQFCLSFRLILSVMDGSVVATALVTIGEYFDDYIKVQWIVLSYLLSYLGFAFIFSRISDILGRKITTILALIFLLIFSLAAGLSSTIEQVIIFRALQGIGGAGLYSLPLTTLPEITPPERFGVMSACMAIVFAVSAVLGPTIGGVITTNSTWLWVFYFNVPCCGFLIVLIWFSWPKTQLPGNGRMKWRQVNFLGCLLFISASVLLVFALQEAGAGTYSWNTGPIIACLTLAGCAAMGMGFWIWFASKGTLWIEPLFRVEIVLHRIILANLLISCLIGYVFYTVLTGLPQRSQIVNNKSAQAAGIDLLPVSGASALGSGLGGFLSSKRTLSFQTLTAGCAFALLGCGLLSSIGYNKSIPDKLYGSETLLGLGIGLTFSPITVVIKLYAKLDEAASAQGLLAQTRILGGNLGLSLASIVLTHRLESDLDGILSPTQIHQLRQSLSVIQEFSPDQVTAVGKAFSASFATQMQICTGLSGAALLLCGLTFERNPPSLKDLKKGQAGVAVRDE